jgi:threonine dehydrogenase-like Zn-dependent dehydrogenase
VSVIERHPTRRSQATRLAAIFIGMHSDETPLPWRKVIHGNHTIRGVFAYSDTDFQQALRWLAGGPAGIGALKAVLPLEEGPNALATLAVGPTDDTKVFLGA